MAVDLDKMSIEELNQLAAEAQAKAQQLATVKELEELEAVEARKERISGAVNRLTNLLGPENAPPYVPGGDEDPSIRSLLAYPPEVMADNSGLALKLLYQGLEELTITTRDLAGVMGSN